MRRIIKEISCCVIILGVLISCTDLEPKIKEFATGEEYLADAAERIKSDPTNALAFIEPVYSSLYNWNGERNLFALTESSTDEMVTPTRGTDWFDNGIWIAMHQHSWTADNLILLRGWGDLSSGVARCYEVLTNLEAISESDPNFRAQLVPYIAEARLLRAYYMWHFVDLFGVVPYLDDALSTQVYNRSDGVAFVISELEAIIPDLLGKEDNPEYGRAVRQTAEALLAKIYLNLFIYEDRAFTNADMDMVIAYCDDVINSGQYSLATDYFSIFDQHNETSPETLLTLQNSGDIGRGFDSQSHLFMTLHYYQVVNGGQPWNGMCATEDFFYAWDTDGNRNNGVQTNDSRFSDDRYVSETGIHLGFLVGQQYKPDGTALEDRLGNPLIYTAEIGDLRAASEVEGTRVVKWAPDTDAAIPQWMDNDVALLRYADVILMKAEALWRKGDNAGALSLINQLRTTRGAGNLTSIGADGSEILAERGFEFYWEGQRRTDLVRFGQFTSGTWWEKPVSEEYRNIYPIPLTALSANDKLTQNEGYN